MCSTAIWTWSSTGPLKPSSVSRSMMCSATSRVPDLHARRRTRARASPHGRPLASAVVRERVAGDRRAQWCARDHASRGDDRAAAAVLTRADLEEAHARMAERGE
jgi:hypothetical protein